MFADSPTTATTSPATTAGGLMGLVCVALLVWYFREPLGAWWRHWRERRAIHKAGTHTTVSKRRKETNHGLHLILTIFTLGAWLPVWICVGMWNAFGPREKTVTKSY